METQIVASDLKERVALDLTALIVKQSGKGTHTQAQILDTYAECYECVLGQRRAAEKPKKPVSS